MTNISNHDAYGVKVRPYYCHGIVVTAEKIILLKTVYNLDKNEKEFK